MVSRKEGTYGSKGVEATYGRCLRLLHHRCLSSGGIFRSFLSLILPYSLAKPENFFLRLLFSSIYGLLELMPPSSAIGVTPHNPMGRNHWSGYEVISLAKKLGPTFTDGTSMLESWVLLRYGKV